MEPRQRRCVPCPGVWTPRGSGLSRVPLRTSPPRPPSWCMVGTDSSSSVRNAKRQAPQKGWRRGGITSGRGTVATRGGLRRVGYALSPACCGPPTRGDPAAAGPAPELERDVRAGATQRQAMGRGWHVTWPIRMGFPPLGARTFVPKACAGASSPLCALTWISLSSFTCGSARGRSCGGPWPRPQSRRRARQEWAPRASDQLHTVSATTSPVCTQGGTQHALPQSRPAHLTAGPSLRRPVSSRRRAFPVCREAAGALHNPGQAGRALSWFTRRGH